MKPLLMPPDGSFSLSYYFLHVTEFPEAGGRFETAMRGMWEQAAGQDLDTVIEPDEARTAPSHLRPFRVTTYTEHFRWVLTDSGWKDRYVSQAKLRVFLWPAKHILIIGASRDVVSGFLQTCARKSNDTVALQPLEVDVEALHRAAPHATEYTLEQPMEDGLPTRNIRKMHVVGEDLEEAPEVKLFRSAGAVGRGLQFPYSMPGWPPIRLSATADGAIRLVSHIGPKKAPNTNQELNLVTSCWDAVVSRHAKIRERKPRQGRSVPKEPKPATPGPIQGQQPLGGGFEP